MANGNFNSLAALCAHDVVMERENSMEGPIEYPEKCSIWGTPATRESFESAGGSKMHLVSGYNVTSPRADGGYAIVKEAHDRLGHPEFESAAKARITTWLVDQRRLGVATPKITLKVLEEEKQRRPLQVQQRADRLLKFIADQIPYIGAKFLFYPNFHVTTGNGLDEEMARILAFTESTRSEEVIYLLEVLEKSNLITHVSQSGRIDYTVSPKGYTYIAELETKTINSTQAFVAMWFDPLMGEAYEKGIHLGIQKAGYHPVRIDRKDHNNKIDDEIVAEIRRSRFLVADFTQGESGARGGVYYEAGFAHGLNIPVIFTCHKDALGNVHLDTRQYNHIAWTTPEDLCERLSQRISATVGDGPMKKP